MTKRYFWGAIVLGASILAARADIIPTLSNTVANGANFTWNYSANVTAQQTVNTGDFFTIFDFGNFVAGSNQQPTGWVFSSALTGITPGTVIPNDNPNLLNLTWTYEGATPITGAQALGTFSVDTTTNQLLTGSFVSEATLNSGPNAGTKIDNVGTVSVPVPEMSALLPILSVCGASLLSLLPGYLRRRQAS